MVESSVDIAQPRQTRRLRSANLHLSAAEIDVLTRLAVLDPMMIREEGKLAGGGITSRPRGRPRKPTTPEEHAAKLRIERAHQLAAAGEEAWWQPTDLGATNRNTVRRVLDRLAARLLVMRRPRQVIVSGRRTWEYRLGLTGMLALELAQAAATQ